MQFVAIKFNPKHERTFVYTHVGEPLAVGDRVDVETQRGEVTVLVVGVFTERPDQVADIELKAITRVFSRASRDDAAHPAPAHSPPADTPPTIAEAGGDTRST